MDEKMRAARMEKLANAAKHPKQGSPGILPLDDDTLEAVSGGQTFTDGFFVIQCLNCGWTVALDNKGEDDVDVACDDHKRKHPFCPFQYELHRFGN